MFFHLYTRITFADFPLSVGRNIAPDFTLIKKGSVVVLTFFCIRRFWNGHEYFFPYTTSKWLSGQDYKYQFYG